MKPFLARAKVRRKSWAGIATADFICWEIINVYVPNINSAMGKESGSLVRVMKLSCTPEGDVLQSRLV